MNHPRRFSTERFATLLFKSISIVAAASFSQPLLAADIIRDINSASEGLGSSGSYRSTIFSIGNVVVFVMDDGVHGAELWRTDGLAGGTYLIKDIQPGPAGSSANGFVELNGRWVFVADDGVNGPELWVTDGTASGTHIVVDINQKAYSSLSFQYDRALTRLGDAVIVSAHDLSGGQELWRSDGTAAGTWRIKDINPGVDPSEPWDFTVVGSLVFFTATTTASGKEPWVTDGTPAGTHLVKDIAAGAQSSNPAELTVANSIVYLRADDQLTGPELWRLGSDGNSATLVADAVPGAAGSFPTHLASLGALVIYAGTGSPGIPSSVLFAPESGEPFRSDGTSAGTYQLKDVYPGPFSSGPSDMMRVGNRVVFRVEYYVGATSLLWSTDGTAVGTQPLYTGDEFDFDNYHSYYRFGSELLFFARPRAGDATALWRTDGTPAGTKVFASLPQDTVPGDDFAVLGGRAFYPAGSCCAGEGIQIWSSDGTPSGTSQLIGIGTGQTGFRPSGLITVGNRIFFYADDGVNGSELWVTDGTAGGSHALGDFNPRRIGAASNPEHFVTIGTKTLLTADDGVHGTELWITDGTASGTKLLKDINPSSATSAPWSAVVMNGFALFRADDGVTGAELWRTDGTSVGTHRVADIFPGTVPPRVCDRNTYCPPPDNNPPPASSSPLETDGLVFNGFLYFVATDLDHGRELWRSNGTTSGTTLFKEFVPGGEGAALSLMAVVGNSFFLCVQEGDSSRLWVSGGTSSSTQRVTEAVDCNAGTISSAAYQGALYFAGRTADNDVELWRSDGTANGTYRVIDLSSGTSPSYLEHLTVVGARLSFSACTPPYNSGGCGFYLSNGTAAGTAQVPGVTGPDGPSKLIDGKLYFDTGGTPRRLYVSDGTVSGTHAAFAATLFPNGVDVTRLTPYLGKFALTAFDGVGGSKFWITDGTFAGTSLLAQLDQDGNGGSLSYFVIGDGLLFDHSDERRGRELWSTHNGAPSAIDDSVTLSGSQSLQIAVLANDTAFAAALDPSTIVIATQPKYGTLSTASSGVLTYSPTNGFSGSDEFAYTVKDLGGRISNPARVKILVAAPLGGQPSIAPVDPTPTTPTTPSAPAPSTSNSESGGGRLDWSVLLLLMAFAAIRIRAQRVQSRATDLTQRR